MLNDTKGAGSEDETAGKMFQAMAEYEQTRGNNITAAEIESGVDKATSTSDIPVQDEDAVAEDMQAESKHAEHEPEYLVRGALLKCQYGSHCRRLNLPECHGVYIKGHPVMSAKDCIAGDEGASINITTFGICKAPGYSTGETIYLIPEQPRDENGRPIEGATAEGQIEGAPCHPQVVEWEEIHPDTIIGPEGIAALTTKSYLLCTAGGGRITVLRSGQADMDE